MNSLRFFLSCLIFLHGTSCKSCDPPEIYFGDFPRATARFLPGVHTVFFPGLLWVIFGITLLVFDSMFPSSWDYH